MKFSVRKKLLVGFISLAGLLFIIAILSVLALNSTSRTYNEMIENQVTLQNNLKEIHILSLEQSLAVRGTLLTENKQSRDDFSTAATDVAEMLEETLALQLSSEQQEMIQSLNEQNQKFIDSYDALIDYLKFNRTQEEKTVFWQEHIYPVGTAIVDISSELSQEAFEQMHAANDANVDRTHMIIRNLIIICVFAVIASLVTGYYISNIIATPIRKVTEATQKLADGDLTIAPIDIKNQDELGKMAYTFNGMVLNLRNLLEQVTISAQQVAASSEQLMASAEETSQSTSNITNAIQEVATGAKSQETSAHTSQGAVAEMSLGISQVAQSTTHVADTSEHSMRIAEEGNTAIIEVVNQMSKINQSTNNSATIIKNLHERSIEIAKIIDVITTISDQTNLLSLNASIEAARAGEHGKGFAVVANEVKNLAEQSKKSADLISHLIIEIQQDTTHAVQAMEQGTNDVSQGMQVVEKAGSKFESIRLGITNTSEQIQEISAIAQQISASVDLVRFTMDQVTTIASQTSDLTVNVANSSEEQLASMEEITASAADLADQSETLLQHVKGFKI